MRVTATPNLRVPMEGTPRRYIEHDPAQPVEVPDTGYYRRRLLEGELVEVPDAPPPAAPARSPAKPSTKAKKGATQ